MMIPYVKRQRCLSEILMLSGHIKYQPFKIITGLGRNIKVFFRFPGEYFKLLARIFYVKVGEWTGLYRTEGRF